MDKYGGIYIRLEDLDTLTLCSGRALKVFWILVIMHKREQREYVYSSADFIAKISQCSKKTVLKAMTELLGRGVISRKTIHYKEDNKFKTKSVYKLKIVEFQ